MEDDSLKDNVIENKCFLANQLINSLFLRPFITKSEKYSSLLVNFKDCLQKKISNQVNREGIVFYHDNNTKPHIFKFSH